MTAPATWTATAEVWIDTRRRAPLAVSGTRGIQMARPTWYYADKFPLRLHVGTGENGGVWTPSALEETDTIAVVAKPAGLTGNDLFYSGIYTAGGAEADPYYDVLLDLRTANLLAALTGITLDAAVDVTITKADGTEITVRIPVTLTKRVDASEEPPTIEGVPAYYTQDQSDAMLSARLRLAAGKRIVVDADGNLSTESTS